MVVAENCTLFTLFASLSFTVFKVFTVLSSFCGIYSIYRFFIYTYRITYINGHPRCSVKKAVLKYFAIFIRDSSKSVFLRILRNF